MRCGLSVTLCLLLTMVVGAQAAVVNIPDANLLASLRAESTIPDTGDITDADMQTLTSLGLQSKGISEITGLEAATNLTELGLSSNQISDVSPLSGLTSLAQLGLESNNISDVSPLSGLTSLTKLGLSSNQISDVSPLSGLTSLTELGLSSNSISSISTLSGLTSLTQLGLESNNISDVSPVGGLSGLRALTLSSNNISSISSLSGLTGLYVFLADSNSISDLSAISTWGVIDKVGLASNQITDLTPLVDNSALGPVSPFSTFDPNSVDVSSNPLSQDALNTQIPALQARGVSVTFTDSNVPIELALFEAVVLKEGVRIDWATASETANLGFHVYRSNAQDGEYTRVTLNLIEGKGTDSTLQEYSFLDETAEAGTTHWYQLEDIAFDGTSKRLQPIPILYQQPLDPSAKLQTLWARIKVR